MGPLPRETRFFFKKPPFFFFVFYSVCSRVLVRLLPLGRADRFFVVVVGWLA